MASPETHNDVDGSGFTYGDTVQAGIGQSDSLFTPAADSRVLRGPSPTAAPRYSASYSRACAATTTPPTCTSGETEVLSTVESEEYNFAAVAARHVTSSRTTPMAPALTPI